MAEAGEALPAGGGVEAGVEVDIEVRGTRVELVAVSAGPESGWRRPTLVMQSQGRKKTVSCGTWSALSSDLNAEEAAWRRAMR
jgi:hypothetical protein